MISKQNSNLINYTSTLTQLNTSELKDKLLEMMSHGDPLKKSDHFERKKKLSMIALSKFKLKIRLKLYKSLIKSMLLYNCGIWVLTKHQEDKLDTYHRKQLRKILGIKYPTRISNAKLYEKCKEISISITIVKARWRLFGHILRRDKDIPAYKAMQPYFDKSPTDKNFRGRERITLPAPWQELWGGSMLHSLTCAPRRSIVLQFFWHVDTRPISPFLFFFNSTFFIVIFYLMYLIH